MSILNTLTFLTGLFLQFSLGTSTDVTVKGPSAAIIGDYEKFTCLLEGEDVTEDYGQEWKFRLKSGADLSVYDTDTLLALEKRSYELEHRKLEVTSFLRMNSANITKVLCYHSPKINNFLEIQVQDLTTVTKDKNPCTDANITGKPVTSIYIPSDNILEPSYRKTHFIDDQNLKLNYPEDVSQITLVCYSPSSDISPVWSFNDKTASKLKYAVWALNDQCKQQVLHIYQIAGAPGEVTNFKFDCTAQSKSVVNLDLTFTRIKSVSQSQLEFLNATENCINEIVEKFYNKELTGVGVASCFVIVLMAVGMAVMKKQLNQQQSINGQLQTKNLP